MLCKAYFTSRPEKILFEQSNDGNRVWLRKNIKKETDEEGNEQYSCDEAYFETGATFEEINDNFNKYFTYASTWEKPKEATEEERLSAVEESVLFLTDVITGFMLGGEE